MKRSDKVILQSLITDLKDGFEVLVRSTQDELYTGILRLTNDRILAEDLAQDVYVRAFRALDRFGPKRLGQLKIRPWLWTIAFNVVKSNAKSTQRYQHSRQRQLQLMNVQQQRDEITDDRYWKQQFSKLTKAQKEAVVLAHVGGLDYAEMSKILKRPINTLKSDVARGLNQLRINISLKDNNEI